MPKWGKVKITTVATTTTTRNSIRIQHRLLSNKLDQKLSSITPQVGNTHTQYPGVNFTSSQNYLSLNNTCIFRPLNRVSDDMDWEFWWSEGASWRNHTFTESDIRDLAKEMGLTIGGRRKLRVWIRGNDGEKLNQWVKVPVGTKTNKKVTPSNPCIVVSPRTYLYMETVLQVR